MGALCKIGELVRFTFKGLQDYLNKNMNLKKNLKDTSLLIIYF